MDKGDNCPFQKQITVPNLKKKKSASTTATQYTCIIRSLVIKLPTFHNNCLFLPQVKGNNSICLIRFSSLQLLVCAKIHSHQYAVSYYLGTSSKNVTFVISIYLFIYKDCDTTINFFRTERNHLEPLTGRGRRHVSAWSIVGS